MLIIETHNFKGRLQFQAVLEELGTSQHVETESGTGQSHNQTSHIPKQPFYVSKNSENLPNMPDMFGSNETKNNVVVLLALIFVHGRDLRRGSD